MNRVGQATDMSASDQTLFDQMMNAGTDAASQAANAISTPATDAGTQTGAQAGTQAAVPSTISPTTLVIGGVLVIGLLWFLTSK